MIEQFGLTQNNSYDIIILRVLGIGRRHLPKKGGDNNDFI